MESAGAVPFSSSCGFLRSFHSLYPPYRFYGHTGIGSVWDFKGSNFSRRSGTSRRPVGNAPFPDHMEHPSSSRSFWRSLRDRPILMRRRYAGLSTKSHCRSLCPWNFIRGICRGSSCAPISLICIGRTISNSRFCLYRSPLLCIARLFYGKSGRRRYNPSGSHAAFRNCRKRGNERSHQLSNLPREESGKHCRRL